MAVRSRRFFGPVIVVGGAGFTGLYTVPALRTARFSVVTVFNADAVSRVWQLGIGPLAGEVTFLGEDLAPRRGVPVAQGLVLNPGDRLACNGPLGATLVVAGFGSLLDGAPS